MAKETEGKKRGWQQEAAKLKDVLIYIFLGGGGISLRTYALITKTDGETQASNLSLRCLGLSDRKHENCKTRLFFFFWGGRVVGPAGSIWLGCTRNAMLGMGVVVPWG